MKRLLNRLFSSKQRIKITLAVAFIVVFIGITLYIILGSLGIHWPTEAQIDSKKAELKKQHRELRRAIKQTKVLNGKEDILEQTIKKFWKLKPDIHIASKMRATIEKCAKDAGLELQSMGNIRTSKLAKGFNKLEIAISANSPMDKIVDFLNNIRQSKPVFFWQQCSIRPDNMTNPNKVYLNATLAIVTVDQLNLKIFLNKETK